MKGNRHIMFGMEKSTQKSVYKTVIGAFKSQNFTFDQNDEEYHVRISFPGDDLDVHMFIKVNDLHIAFTCYLPFKADEGKFKDVAWRLNEINLGLSFGAFGIDPEDGIIQFEYGYIFTDAKPTKDLILSITAMVMKTVDRFDGELSELAPVIKSGSDSIMFG